jgi:hypothetical protein
MPAASLGPCLLLWLLPPGSNGAKKCFAVSSRSGTFNIFSGKLCVVGYDVVSLSRRGGTQPTATPRDEPGSGGVRVGQTGSDLDCRVVATSRRVAPTECDSRLPLFGRGSTCRLRLLDSWPPPGSGVVFDSEFRVQSLFELTNSKPTKLALKAVPSEQRTYAAM